MAAEKRCWEHWSMLAPHVCVDAGAEEVLVLLGSQTKFGLEQNCVRARETLAPAGDLALFGP